MIDVLAAASALHNEQEVAQQMFYTNGQLLISNFVITTVTVICLFLMESLNTSGQPRVKSGVYDVKLVGHN